VQITIITRTISSSNINAMHAMIPANAPASKCTFYKIYTISYDKQHHQSVGNIQMTRQEQAIYSRIML